MIEQKKSVKKTTTTRRQFVVGATAAALMIVPRHVLGGKAGPAPSEKLNLGSIGVGGMQGAGDVGSVSSENIYALCDVDQTHLNKTAARYPKAKLYRDFRKMLDKEHKNLDGVTVTIPDFMHATASVWAMERGIAVHCQKPLTATVWEARLLANAARKYKVATQMGNQGYSSAATRIACEYIWNDEIGDITEVHSWNGGGFSRGIVQWPPPEPVPAYARLEPLAGTVPGAHLQLEDPSDQLARVPGLRHHDDRRLGHPPARAGQLGAGSGRDLPDERGMYRGDGSQSRHVSQLRLQDRSSRSARANTSSPAQCLP